MRYNTIYAFIAILIIGFGCVEKSTKSNPVSAETIVASYGSHPLQNMTLYLPKNRDSKTKTIVMVHGGGWVMGYKPDGKVTTFSGRFGWDILNPLIDEGYACAVIKYRTACYNSVSTNFTNNSTKYQDQMMEDIDLAINHIISNAGTYKIGDNHFQLLGESSGGHTVMTYAIRHNANPAVKSAASMFGPTDLDSDVWQQYLQSLPLVLTPEPNYFLKASDNCTSVTNKQVQIFSSMKSFCDHQNLNTNGTDPFLYPLCPSRPENILNTTPIFVMHGRADSLVPAIQADKMYDALVAKNGGGNCTASDFSCQYKKEIYDNCGHGWIGNCNKQQIMNDIVNWMNSH